MCRTRCWLSEELGLFRQSPGASGPTAGGFLHPSGLGTGSGSGDNVRLCSSQISSRLLRFGCLEQYAQRRTHLPPHYGYLFVKLSSVETRVFLPDTVDDASCLRFSPPSLVFPHFNSNIHFILCKDVSEHSPSIP